MVFILQQVAIGDLSILALMRKAPQRHRPNAQDSPRVERGRIDGMTIHTAVATIHTNHGDIVVNLYGNHAPKTVDNFVGLATGTREWTHPQTGQATTEPYLLAMANAGKRGGRGTNGSQFFITTVATPWLNGNHTIFGAVADDASRKVVDAIEAVPTGAGDKPLEDVVISSIEVAQAA